MFTFATTNYTNVQLHRESISDESFLNQYKASPYPCFFDTENEVVAYGKIWEYCYKKSNGEVGRVHDIFPSSRLLECFIASLGFSVTDSFFQRVNHLLHEAPFLPHVDVASCRFIPDTVSIDFASSDVGLVDLSAAVSYRQSFHAQSEKEQLDFSSSMDFLLDEGLIVCVSAKRQDAIALVQRYAAVTKRPFIDDSLPGTDFLYKSRLGDHVVLLSGSLLTSFTIPQAVSVLTIDCNAWEEDVFAYIMAMPTSIFVESQRVSVNRKHVSILAMSRDEFGGYFSDQALSHHNVICLS